MKPSCSVLTRIQGFPANKITVNVTADKLVVTQRVRYELSLIETWVKQQREFSSETGIGRSISPGYCCLFWGPPGTGKTLAAGLLGQSLGTEVYRIDLSTVVSNWIGETEKNLSIVIDEAERNGSILFFDEADALFATRTKSNSSNDRYANQKIAYLLQRIESYPGVAILATKMRSTLHDAFMRRMQSVVNFSLPDAQQREKLWQQMLSSQQHESVNRFLEI